MTGYAFILPLMVGFAAFVALPIVSVAWYSLHEWNLVYGNFDLVWFDNYSRFMTDPEMRDVALATIVFMVGYVPLNVALGLTLALAVDTGLRGAVVFRTIYFAPVVVSLVAWAIVYRFILQEQGVLNAALSVVGITGPNWLREDIPALASVVITQLLKTVGLSMVLFLAALQTIPGDVRQAAIVDGAGSWALFRRITLPLVTPYGFLVVVLSLISAVRAFPLIHLLTHGGPGSRTRILPYYVYTQGFERLEMGYASALAILLLVLVLGVTAAQFALRRRWSYLES